MRHLLCALVLLCFAGIANATGLPALEIPIDISHGVPEAKVMINGKGPYTFIVDTGSGDPALISPKLAADLNLPQVGTSETVDPTNNKSTPQPLFEAETLEIGSFKASKAKMLGLDTGIDGVIGLPMFKDYLTVFEPLPKRIVLRNESLGSANGADILSYTAPDGIPDMEMQVGEATQPMHLDSGNPGFLSLNKSMTTNLEWIVPPEEIGKAMTVSNTFSIYEGRLKSDLHLGKYVLTQPFVSVVDVGNHINFGFGAFRQFRSVAFDQTNRRVRFENDGTTIVLPAEGKHGPKGH